MEFNKGVIYKAGCGRTAAIVQPQLSEPGKTAVGGRCQAVPSRLGHGTTCKESQGMNTQNLLSSHPTASCWCHLWRNPVKHQRGDSPCRSAVRVENRVEKHGAVEDKWKPSSTGGHGSKREVQFTNDCVFQKVLNILSF